MKKRRSTPAQRALLTGAALVTCTLALDVRLMVRRYTVPSDKLTRPVRLALVADLHSCKYGPKQKTLCSTLKSQCPDLVLMAGDIVDDRRSQTPALDFLAQVAAEYPCAYVTGNHEYRSGQMPQIKDHLRALGITVLAGTCTQIELQGQRLNLCGLDDPRVGEHTFLRQLEATRRGRNSASFSLLLSHRPERILQYLPYGFDLVLSGHAHGGQWRMPGLINGLFAPHQGFFPAYAGGCYPLQNTTLVVSRGLARESTHFPRVFNRPELVVVDLVPKA